MFGYGFLRRSGKRSPLIPTGRTLVPIPPPEKVYHDRSSKCLGCPYPAHGLMCHDNRLDGACLRTDMQELDAKHQREYLKKEDEMSTIHPESLSISAMAIADACR